MHKFILRRRRSRKVNKEEIETIYLANADDKQLFSCFDSYFAFYASLNQGTNKEYVEDHNYMEELILQEEKNDFQMLLNLFEKDVLSIRLPKEFILGMIGYYEQTYNIRCLALCLLIFKVQYPNEKLLAVTEFFRLQKNAEGGYGYLNPFIQEGITIDEKKSFKIFATILIELCLEVERG